MIQRFQLAVASWSLAAAMLLVLFDGTHATVATAAEPTPAATPTATAIAPAPQMTPSRLASALEQAWMGGDANAIASLCDSATVRIALKPGAPPASAPTLSAAAFLIHDQLGLVGSIRFEVTRLETDPKRRTAKAWARWQGTFGGAKTARDVRVYLTAHEAIQGGWLLTEIRATD